MNGGRLASAGVLKLLGVTGVFVTWQAYDPTVGLLTIVLGNVLPSFLSIGLVGAGTWMLFTDDLDDRGVSRVLEWSVAGMVGLGTLGGAALFFQRQGYVLDRPLFIITSTVVSGAVAGFGIGFYDVWSNRHREQLAEERENLDHLNQLLRHHLLNGMNVMLAKIDMATDTSDDPAVTADLADARDRGEEIVALVEQVSAIAGVDDTGRTEIDICRLLEGEAERIRAVHGTDAVRLVEPLPDVQVRSNRALGEALGVILEDTVTTGGGRATVSATVDSDTAIVSVTATGPGPAPDGGDHLLGGPGSDVGLSVADVLIERSGGELVTPATAEDTVQVRLPVA
jgi:hypothetical protein